MIYFTKQICLERSQFDGFQSKKKTVTKITNRKHAKKHTNILIPEIADWFYKPVNAIHYNWKMIAINFINGFCDFNTVVIAQEQNFSNLSHNNGRNLIDSQ